MDFQSKRNEERSLSRTEYVLKLLTPSPQRIERLKSQMEHRLNAGRGEAKYIVGLNWEGQPVGLTLEELDSCISVLGSVAESLDASLLLLAKEKKEEGYVGELLIRKKERQGVIMDIRVALLGASGVGKTSLVGVLSKGVMDNGKGKAKNSTLLHKHEKKIGCTTSVTQHLVGFDTQGQVLRSKKGWEQLVCQSSKLISLIDLPGHAKYKRNLLYGMSSQNPDYCLIVYEPSEEPNSTFTDHLALASALKLPIFIVISKIDKFPQIVIDRSLDYLQAELRSHRRTMMEVTNFEDVVLYSRLFAQEQLAPVFSVSFVTGCNLDLLLSFLNLLPAAENWESTDSYPEFYIEKWFEKEGLIIGGVMIKGKACALQRLMLGPDNRGKFRCVQIMGIHVNKVPVRSVSAGQFCSFKVTLGSSTEKWLRENELRKGMVLVDKKVNPRAAFEFQCLIWPIDSVKEARTLKSSYEPMIYTQTISQCARVVGEGKTIVPGQSTNLTLRFLYHPEYVSENTRFIIRDTFMTALGTITSLKFE